MDRNEIVWVLECCLLSLDGVTKKQILEFGCPEEIVDIGIQLYNSLKNKEVLKGLKYGC